LSPHSFTTSAPTLAQHLFMPTPKLRTMAPTTADDQLSEEHDHTHEPDTDSEDEPEPETEPFLSSSSASSSEQPRRSSIKKDPRPALLSRLSYLSYTSVSQASRVAATQVLSINILWPFVPLGLVVGYLKWKAVPTSAFNFLAIIPLSAAVSDASDKLSDEFGDLWGALINATFGNAVELIVSPPFNTSKLFSRR
jgi:hypothetical protein